MAVLKSLTTLIVTGKVIPADETFECPDALADSLVKRGFASNLKEAQAVDPSLLNAPEGDKVPEADPREAEIRSDYAKMDKEELIDTAKAIGVEVKSSWNKDRIIDALVKAEIEAEEE